LTALNIEGGSVLLPAYIGWSPREGSGVFDPIASLGLNYEFYALDEGLRIEMESLQAALRSGRIRVLVLIHFFGFVDPAFEEVVKLARDHGVFVLEDEAHAMLTDMVGGICGRLGDACIYSFHKMLPVESGGAVVLNDPASSLAGKLSTGSGFPMPVFDFDLAAIAARRRANSLLLDRLVRDLAPGIEPLFGAPRSGVVPQTYPVLIRSGSRDDLYHRMNAAGFGVVSLYHTLIAEISPEQFPATADISRKIMNLPVHQDATPGELEAMMGSLAFLVKA
jgi:dTDP-4-amino-4,6-dideoxygalactose transaminase